MELADRLDPRSFEDVAGLLLPEPTRRWIAAGGDGPDGDPNVTAFASWRLRPHALVDIPSVSTAVTVLGTPVETPVLAAPIAAQRTMHPDGERAMATGVAAAGSLMVVAVNATTTVEEIAEATPDAPRWLQLGIWTDRDALAALISRAEAAGCSALAVLVNAPIGVAHVDPRAGFSLPPGVRFAHFETAPALDPRAGAEALAWIVAQTRLPVVAKGVLRGDDARRAVDAGAAGIVVSNHGARQLPRAVATIDALEEVVHAAGSVEVYIEGGIRTGSDVLVALALGARATFLGRPLAWALAAAGQHGVRRTIAALTDELRADATLAGIPDLAAVPRDLAVRAGPTNT